MCDHLVVGERGSFRPNERRKFRACHISKEMILLFCDWCGLIRLTNNSRIYFGVLLPCKNKGVRWKIGLHQKAPWLTATFLDARITMLPALCFLLRDIRAHVVAEKVNWIPVLGPREARDQPILHRHCARGEE